MTLYLLVMTDDGEDSYSLWATEQDAKREVRYLKEKTGLSIYCFNIYPLEVYS